MLKQLLTIAWAQWRIARNHLPRTTVGSLLGAAIGVVWYGGFTVLAAFLASTLSAAPASGLRQWIGVGLFGVFCFWQIIPLVTLSGGWSLDLKRLQVYPLSVNTLLIAEIVLRISAGVEMIVVLTGAAIGLALNPEIPLISPLALLLYIPFNLFLSLAIRDVLSTAFRKKRFLREIFAVALISLGVLPQLLVRYYAIHHRGMQLMRQIDATFTPWHAIGALATANDAGIAAMTVFAWLALALVMARWQFGRLIETEELVTAPAAAESSRKWGLASISSGVADLFRDPMSALIEKELRSLIRMPRFRVVFLLASVFSVIILLPMQMQSQQNSFVRGHSLQLMNVYGILILSDALLWNMFGFDRAATQVYFAAPTDFAAVMRAKNITAGLFMACQTLICIVFASLVRIQFSVFAIVIDLLGAAVVTLLFVCIGNIGSVANPRPADPKATMRKQNAGIVQLWMLGCALCAMVLLGAAYLAGWATDSNWAAIGVLLLEIGIGAIAYRFSVESAVEKASRERERFLTALDKSSSPVSI